jgi:hypothetical protein
MKIAIHLCIRNAWEEQTPTAVIGSGLVQKLHAKLCWRHSEVPRFHSGTRNLTLTSKLQNQIEPLPRDWNHGIGCELPAVKVRN